MIIDITNLPFRCQQSEDVSELNIISFEISGWFSPKSSNENSKLAAWLQKSLRQIIYEFKSILGFYGEYNVIVDISKSGVKCGKRSYYCVYLDFSEVRDFKLSVLLNQINILFENNDRMLFFKDKK